ncbi:MAG: NAD(P)/FAD-dependent oxidoreductase [Pseudomonadota bacterium]
MANSLQIAIVGSGIGGLAAATLLARSGHSVRVFDQFDAPKPIGSGLMLQQTGLAVLGELGLRARMETLGSRIDRLWGLTTPALRPVLDVQYHKWKSDLYGIGVQRGLVFNSLLETALSSGVELVPNTLISGLEADGAELILKSGERITGMDLVVLAHGARSNLTQKGRGQDLPYGALWATLSWPENSPFDSTALEQRYLGARQMSGVMASGRLAEEAPETLTYFWSIKANQEPVWRIAPLEAWKAKAETLWPETKMLLDQFDSHDQLTFARYRHHTAPTPLAGRKAVRLGDSWHAASPQLGQGANMALLDAWALSKALSETDDLSEAFKHYVKLRQFHVRLYQLMTWAFTPVYQGDSRILPWLRDWLAAPLSKIWPAPPLLAAMVSGLIGAPLGRLDLLQRNEIKTVGSAKV